MGVNVFAGITDLVCFTGAGAIGLYCTTGFVVVEDDVAGVGAAANLIFPATTECVGCRLFVCSLSLKSVEKVSSHNWQENGR